ncbi:response regulator [Sphingomonas floccifaciens]|uniref:Response regulator n=1 Tax=Sphingomonas floccifaciens TaxID=1844115 RepID=A0ABW4N7I7_9SPHN
MTEKSTVPYALAVDDDPLIVMDVCNILEDAGFRCLDAMSVAEAQALLLEHEPSIALLFSDVDMGDGHDGFYLARWVAERFDEVEIVIASGAAVPAMGDLPDRATFLRKPFSAATVKEHLAETLPDHKKPAPLRRAV